MNSLEQSDKQIQDYHTCHLKKTTKTTTCPPLYRQGRNVNLTQHRRIRRMLKQSACLTLTECSLTRVDRHLKSCRNQQQHFFSPFEFSCEDISPKGASWFVQHCLKCDCHTIGVFGQFGQL